MNFGIFRTIVVPQNHCTIIETFGKPAKLLKSGLNIIFPWFGFWHTPKDVSSPSLWGTETNKQGIFIELSEQVTDVHPRGCVTKDNVGLGVDCIISWRISDPLKAVYTVDHLHKSLKEKVLTAVRAQIGSRTLDNVLTARAELSNEIVTSITGALAVWGITVVSVEIQELLLDKNVKAAMLQQMEAERKARAIALEAEGTKKALEMKAEAEKNAAILQAEGRKAALSITAEAQKAYLKELTEIVGAEAATRILLNMQTLEGYSTITENPASKVYLPSNLPAMVNMKD